MIVSPRGYCAASCPVLTLTAAVDCYIAETPVNWEFMTWLEQTLESTKDQCTDGCAACPPLAFKPGQTRKRTRCPKCGAHYANFKISDHFFVIMQIDKTGRFLWDEEPYYPMNDPAIEAEPWNTEPALKGEEEVRAAI